MKAPQRDSGAVLLIDPDPDCREQLANELVESGFLVFTSDSGNGALQLLKRQRPDLIITEIDIQDIDGFHLCSMFQERLPSTPVMVVSSLDDCQACSQSIARGAMDYIEKPVRPGEVSVRAKRCISEKQLLTQINKHREHQNRVLAEIDNVLESVKDLEKDLGQRSQKLDRHHSAEESEDLLAR